MQSFWKKPYPHHVGERYWRRFRIQMIRVNRRWSVPDLEEEIVRVMRLRTAGRRIGRMMLK